MLFKKWDCLLHSSKENTPCTKVVMKMVLKLAKESIMLWYFVKQRREFVKLESSDNTSLCRLYVYLCSLNEEEDNFYKGLTDEWKWRKLLNYCVTIILSNANAIDTSAPSGGTSKGK